MQEIPTIFYQRFQGKGPEILISPGPHLYDHRWSDYQWRWLRSMHIDSVTESIISCGLPKFMMLGHGKGKFHFGLDDILAFNDVTATD